MPKKNSAKEYLDENYQRRAEQVTKIAEEWFKICGWLLLCATFGFLSNSEIKQSIIPDALLLISSGVGLIYFSVKYMPLFLVSGGLLFDRLKLPNFFLVPAIMIGALLFLLSFLYIMDLIVFFSKNVSFTIHS